MASAFSQKEKPAPSWKQEGLKSFRKGLTPERHRADKNDLARVFRLAEKAPILEQALEWARSNNVKFIVDRTVLAGGYYTCGTGVVAICAASFSDRAYLAGVAVHEIRHAWQDYHGLLPAIEKDYANHFIKIGLIEADATAHQTLAQHQVARAEKLKRLDALDRAYFSLFQQETNDTEKFLWQAFCGWYSSSKPAFYQGTFSRSFGHRLRIPGVTPRDLKAEFLPGYIYWPRQGVDFMRDEQLRRLGKSFGGKNYFNAAARCQMAKVMLSPSRALNAFNDASGKPDPLVSEIRRRELKGKYSSPRTKS